VTTTAVDGPDDARAVLVLGHGAGGDLDQRLIATTAIGLIPHGIRTVRFNFPYRDKGRRAPGSQSVSEDCFREVAGSVRSDGIPLYCGGASYGGRMATHIASSGFSVDGLVLLSYPLHAPGRSDKLRDEHLAAIDAPMLFISGTKDPFATFGRLERVVGRLGRATLHPIAGGDHSLGVRGRDRKDVMDEVVETIATFIA